MSLRVGKITFTPRVQQRGPITDHLRKGPDGTALCVCAHGKEWPEGDYFEPEGKACRECVQAWMAEAPDA